MTRLTLHLALSLLAASALAAPAPAPAPGSSSTTFSWSGWVEDIIANPDTALTPDEAVEAATASQVVTTSGGLQKRAPDCGFPANFAPVCPPTPLLRYNARVSTTDIQQGRDAAACLDDLTRKGQRGVMCGMPNNVFNIQMCRIGRAQVIGSRGTFVPEPTNCINVARTGGLIFDSCWRSGDIVKGSEACINNGVLTVRIGAA
ncbi:Putative protein of unknown function [Podospora comata]|uniref:Ecp2 effector protein domain-containing protein n=1 Tax=Podospora comata TaxID=48703 RepID=A0ABY6S9P5_PODCO|nr:Putative protein of unknown function [Podospora comata]